jgi:thiol-disulfide isomerase/thioredoxin
MLFAVLAAKISLAQQVEDTNTFIWDQILGPTLYRWAPNGTETAITEEPTEKLLKGIDVVGIYYSASWCGPCRQFTPMLAKFYAEMKKKGAKFEIVWISRDRSPEEFVGYFEKMPWLACTWENFQQVAQQTSGPLKVQGIPHFVLLEADDATVITYDGRTEVSRDKFGLEFPWRPRTITSLIPKSIRKAAMKQIDKHLSKAKSAVEGLLSGLGPKKVMSWVSKKLFAGVKSIAGFAKSKIEGAMNSNKGQGSQKANADGGGAALQTVDAMIDEEL